MKQVSIRECKSYDYDVFRASFEKIIEDIGGIDKFATQMDCKYINLTVIQPNLITTSIYETSINKFLHEYDFSLIWS